MLCCLPFFNNQGTCVICLKSCCSKACKCSYYHKECMNDMVRRTRSITCTICNSRFKRLWLESQPKQTEEEVEIVEFYEKKHHVETIQKIHSLKTYFETVFPVLLDLYPYMKHYKKVHEIVIINDITSDAVQANSMYQRLMDRGMKSDRAKQLVKTMFRIRDEYNLYPLKVRRAIHRLFCKKING